MKINRHQINRLCDLARSLVYPLIPIFALGCLWMAAMAGSLESRVARELGPFARKNVPIIHPARLPAPVVVSVDVQPQSGG